MSGSRLTRKVTVEGSKKMTDASAPRKSVFDRLGPGGLERSQSRRDDYSELLVEKCRYWMKDGRCPFGNKCRYDHGSTSEAKSKLKIIRSIVSKNEESGEKKSVVRVKRVHSPEDDLADHTPKKITKRMKPESVKVSKESLREESQALKENKKGLEESKFAEKKKEFNVRTLSTSSSGWNLQDNSDSEDGIEKQLDWEVRGAMHRARNVALEERRNDLRRQIAKIDEHDQPVMTITNMPLADDSSPPFQEEDAKPEKKKKSKSDKSKKKTKKKSHKNEVQRMEGFVGEAEYGEKQKKSKSSSGKKKKKYSNDSDREMQSVEVPYRKGEYENEVFQRDFYEKKKRSDDFHSPLQAEQARKSRHSNDLRREKNPDSFEPEACHYDKRNRSPVEARSSAFERKHQPSQFEREQHHDKQLPRGQLDRETLQLEREERQFERESRQLERERQAQVEKESRQLKMESQHLERESRKSHYEKESRQAHTEREPSREPQFERESRPPTFERELRHPKFERECLPALKRETSTTHLEKEIRSSHYEQALRSSTFDRRSGTPPFEARSSQLESLSPVMDKKHHQHQIEHSHTEEHITRSDREKQKPSKTSVSQKLAESHSKESRVGKKPTTPRSPPGEKQQVSDEKEFVKEQRKPNSRDADSLRKEVKQRAAKTEEVTAFPIKDEQHQAKAQKPKFGHQVRKKKGPRTPSPEFKQLPLSLDIETAVALDTPAMSFQKREKRESRPKPLEPALPKEVKVRKKDKPVAKEQVNESISESSDSNSSSSSDESQSEEVESGSTDEVKSRNARKQHVKRETKKKKVSPKKPKRQQRQIKKISPSRDHLAQVERSAEGTKERPVEDAKHFTEERERHPEDRKERASNNERHEDERFYREHARDHRRTRNDETERRVDSRGSKDIRDARDSRDKRDYRDFPRVGYRDLRERERFRGFDERDRHHPFDVRHDYRDGPPDFRAGWSREMRGRDGYDAFDAREYDERREYERHYERDRPHPERGGRFREIEDHPDVAWYERRGERDYRESERHHEGRERYQEAGKTSRTKRSRASLEPSRGERKGAKTRKERIRGSGTPLEESEEWDYEEGHSPAAPEVKDQQNSSRKRPKESPVRSPHSDSVKRKKVSPPESLTPKAAEGSCKAVQKKESTSKEDEKDSKKSKKDKGKTTARQKLEEETGTIEAAAASPESKEVRETSKDKDGKKAKFEGQTETTKKRDSDVEADGKTGKEVNNTEEAEKLSTAKPEKKCDDQVFSDWSDGSEVNALKKTDGGTNVVESQEQDKVGKVKNERDNFDDGSFEDVYDPISDDELEAIIADDKQESIVRERAHTLDIEDVDWSILEGKSEKISEPGDYIKRFSAGNIFSHIGFSSTLAGPTLSNTVREKCAQDASDKEMKDLLVPSGHVKLRIGALVAAEARKLTQRMSVVNDIGPCRRALCARRDFHIRKQLRRLTTTKLGTKLLLDNAAVEHVDSELLAMSVSIFRRRVTDVKDESPTKSSALLKSPQVLAC